MELNPAGDGLSQEAALESARSAPGAGQADQRVAHGVRGDEWALSVRTVLLHCEPSEPREGETETPF